MTTTYDPDHPQYYDEGDLRQELTRVYDLCHGCRLCFNLCPAFPSMFDMIDARDGDVAGLTAAEQDRVVSECYDCKLCYVKCPYIPPHEWELDFPELMLRARAVKHRQKRGVSVTNQALSRLDLLGKASSAAAPIVNRITQRPGSLARRVMEKTAGIASERLLPPYAKQRFSTWFKRRPAPAVAEAQATVALFPSCFVEYQNPAIGKDAVKVLERNRVECELPEGQVCCGIPWLGGGDFDHFKAQAAKNVEVLASAVRNGRTVVVCQPTCAYVLKKQYPQYLRSADAKLVSENTRDLPEFLWQLHKGETTSLDTEFAGTVPESVTFHVACHTQAQNVGLKSRDLMKLTGTKIQLVNRCSGIDGSWGYRAENYELSRKVAQPLAAEIEQQSNEVVTGDCHLANFAIVEETGKQPVHPIQMLARAYGIPDEDA
jgi:glycerol-3-phosphate dehydrogenase subunit C